MLRYFLRERLFRSTPAGKIFSVLEMAVKAHRLFVFSEAMRQHAEDAQVGLNHEEERFHVEKHGDVEHVFPFELELSSFPEHMERLVGEDFSGRYVFKLSEWNDLVRWFEVIFHNAVSDEKKMPGRDGRWLLHIGRERWNRDEWRETALANVRENPKLPPLVPGMLAQT